MARSYFAGTSSDFVYAVTSGGLLRLASANLTFWSAQTGGTRYTDLLLNDVAVTNISVGADGQIPRFQGPDGVTQMWADAGGGRVLIAVPGASGTPGAPGAPGLGVPSGGTTGQVLVKTSGADNATAWADPATGSVPTADTTTKGIAERATTTEATTGTDDTRFVTPAGVKAVISALQVSSSTYYWDYADGSYPTPPATKPPGCVALVARGPVQPSSYPDWTGIGPGLVLAEYRWFPTT